MNDKVDIIIPWVDGNDQEWITEKLKTEEKYNIIKQANSNIRYESWDNLQYIFRAIEKFMPWVQKVFFVTYGHLPSFLNLNNPKLRVVKHSDYIPKQYLPTFNSNVIELNYHRIEELSENFILFNDDCYPLKPIHSDYYFREGIPCDEAIESPIVPVDVGAISNYASFVKANNILFINNHFNKREVQKKIGINGIMRGMENYWNEIKDSNIGTTLWAFMIIICRYR